MSNHLTGLSLGPPLGDQRLDLCDLYDFPSPTDSTRTVLILSPGRVSGDQRGSANAGVVTGTWRGRDGWARRF